ncbi:MAG: ABC transporter substrate-binding protein [Ottowia sp.]|uniref:ABC transporter substrate-binding protein n=1 Tax=Ottowia sp. TaxID=1898956 RepID=UPI003C762D09
MIIPRPHTFFRHAALILACGGFAASACADQDIKIGALMAFSGPATSWGVSIAGAAELAAEEVNASGGLEVGGKKHKVSIVRYDDKFKANDAVTGMNRLVYEDKARFVITLASASQLAIAGLATENKVLSFTHGFSSKVLDPSSPYAFRISIPADEFAPPQAAWLATRLNAKKIGVLVANDEGGQQNALDLAKAYSGSGGTIAKELFERDRTDFAPLITRLLQQKIDALDLGANSPTTAGLMIKQARELGFKGPIIRTGGEATADIVTVAGKTAAEGLYVHLPTNFQDAQVSAYQKRFESKYKIPMSATSVATYAAVKLLFSAIQKAGSAEDIPKITAALEGQRNAPSILGQVNWKTSKDSAGKPYGTSHQMSSPFYVGQVRNGQLQIVASCDATLCK